MRHSKSCVDHCRRVATFAVNRLASALGIVDMPKQMQLSPLIDLVAQVWSCARVVAIEHLSADVHLCLMIYMHYMTGGVLVHFQVVIRVVLHCNDH